MRGGGRDTKHISIFENTLDVAYDHADSVLTISVPGPNAVYEYCSSLDPVDTITPMTAIKTVFAWLRVKQNPLFCNSKAADCLFKIMRREKNENENEWVVNVLSPKRIKT